MTTEFKTMEQREAEIRHLRQRVAELETWKSSYEWVLEANRQSEAKFKSLAENSLTGICVHQDGRLVYVNDRYAKNLGYSAEELIGKSLLEIVAPEDRESAEHRWRARLAGKEVRAQHEVRHLSRDGNMRWLEVWATRIEHSGSPAILANVIDITERKQAEDSLKASEQRLELALKGADLGLWDWNLKTGRAVWNERATGMLGYSPDEVKPNLRSWKRLVHPEDWPKVSEVLNSHLGGRLPLFEVEYRIRCKSEEWKWILTRAKIVEYDTDGKPFRMTGTTQDVTDRKSAQVALEESEERYRLLYANTPAMLHSIDPAGRLIAVSKKWLEVLGYELSEVIGRKSTDFLTEDSRDYATTVVLPEFFRTGSCKDVPYQFVKKNGEVMEVLLSGISERDSAGQMVRSLAVMVDVTEQKKAQESLKQSEEKYRLVVANAQESILVAQDGMLRFVNPKIFELLSYSEEELLSKPFTEFIHPDDRDTVLRRHLRRLKGEEFPSRYSFRLLDKDGAAKWVEIDSAVISWEGRPAALIFMTDITERVRMEEALKQSEEWYRTLVEESFDGVFVQEGLKIIFANSRLYQMLGYSKGELEGLDHWLVYHPEYHQITRERALARMRGEEFASQYEVKLQRKDGSSFDGEISARAVKVKGEPGVQVWVRDISERKRSEEVQRRLATAVEQVAEAIVITDAQGNIQYVNPSVEQISGYKREEVVGKATSVFKSGEHDQAFYKHLWETIKRGEVWTGRFINKRKDGSLYHEEATISPVRDSSGEIMNFVAVKRDITKHLELSRQLLQAQKMEAIGTLAGGIAHDFNNLLQVTLGYSELLLVEKREDDPEYADLSKIFQAAKSGAELVRRLLTFSRKVEPKPITLNLNRRILQVEKFLRRTIPKMIEIQLDLSGDLAEINADSTQMEQLLMNLAVNARDAMPDGGKLTVGTRNVTLDEEYCRIHAEAKPGEYVLLTVSDTGHGMDKATIEHIFEPFYTTKELGRGTGLGLATVYGIVKQHEGYISCYSEVELGTTFNVYLPAVETQVELDVEKTGVMPAFGTETILLVDDEELVRDLGARILSRAGYNVLTATNGREALDLFEKERTQISLVILDLIMPEMGGKECLKKLRKIDPQAKVLIASGLSADPSAKESVEMGTRGFVSKPFRMKELLRQVRKVLDES